jgi:nucleotide-binding universal stress UspA family protein
LLAVQLVAIWLAVVIGSMLVAAYLARRWGHDTFGWLFLSAVMGPLAIVALVGTRQREQAQAAANAAQRPTAPAGRRVIVACDASDASTRAALYAAQTFGDAEVVLVTVDPHEREPRTEDETAVQEQRVAERTRRAADACSDAGVAVRVTGFYGNPGEEIVRAAKAERAEAIVLGRRGAGLSQALLGSVSDYVVKNANQPVIIVS